MKLLPMQKGVAELHLVCGNLMFVARMATGLGEPASKLGPRGTAGVAAGRFWGGGLG